MESKRKEEKLLLETRRSGQMVDDGTPLAVLLPQMTKKAERQEDIDRAEQKKEEGNGFFRTKDYDKAIVAYTEGIKYNGGNQILWGNRCACFLKLKKWDAAVFDASAALHIDATWLKVRVRLGQAFMGLERYEDAAVALWEVVRELILFFF